MLATERTRYELTLTPAVRGSDDYRAGVLAASDLDPLTVAGDFIGA